MVHWGTTREDRSTGQGATVKIAAILSALFLLPLAIPMFSACDEVRSWYPGCSTGFDSRQLRLRSNRVVDVDRGSVIH